MLTMIWLADFSTKHRNPLPEKRLGAPLCPILSDDVVGAITNVDSANLTIPVVNASSSASTTPSLMTTPSTSTTATESLAAAPLPTSLEVPVPVSTAAVPATECPTPDPDTPSTSSLPAAAASSSALDSVDASSGTKKCIRTNAGKKSTRMCPGATLTARCVLLVAN